MPFTIVRQDITRIKVDAIVNAANTSLRMGGGVCGAIKAAGADDLQAACDKLAPIQTGDAVITPGFNLPVKYVIHTAGPVYRDGQHGEEGQLRLCYINSLKRALENKCKSVAFPLISSGIYGYPKEAALRIATAAIQDFLMKHEMDVFLAVFDRAALAVSEKLLGAVASYIDEHYVDEHASKRRYQRQADDDMAQLLQGESLDIYFDVSFSIAEATAADGLDDLVGRLDEPFSSTLLRLIDAKGRTDIEVYKRANLDRKLFSKIRTGKYYMPSKRTALALAVALELSLAETGDLLKRAGYALSRSQKLDVIVEFFIVNGHYDLLAINEVLFKYDQPLLGG